MNNEHWNRREWLLTCTAAALATNAGSGLAADVDKITAARLKTLRTCESLTTAFRYFGEQDKPFYQITYHLGDFDAGAGNNPFHRITKMDRDAMLRLLDGLAKDGFIAAAHDVSTKDFQPPPGYNLTLTAKKTGGGDEFKALGWQAIKRDGHVELYQAFGWDLKMIERLERLERALDGEAAKNMELLLARLSGLKIEWQKKP
jgi:hypothetical protein